MIGTDNSISISYPSTILPSEISSSSVTAYIYGTYDSTPDSNSKYSSNSQTIIIIPPNPDFIINSIDTVNNKITLILATDNPISLNGYVVSFLKKNATGTYAYIPGSIKYITTNFTISYPSTILNNDITSGNIQIYIRGTFDSSPGSDSIFSDKQSFILRSTYGGKRKTYKKGNFSKRKTYRNNR
jgi:hypothetical protein